MRLLCNEAELNDFITSNNNALVYFSNNDDVCKGIRESLNTLETQHSNVAVCEINLADLKNIKEVEAVYDIYTLPISLFFNDGKEVFRASKYVDINEIKHNIEKFIK